MAHLFDNEIRKIKSQCKNLVPANELDALLEHKQKLQTETKITQIWNSIVGNDGIPYANTKISAHDFTPEVQQRLSEKFSSYGYDLNFKVINYCAKMTITKSSVGK